MQRSLLRIWICYTTISRRHVLGRPTHLPIHPPPFVLPLSIHNVTDCRPIDRPPMSVDPQRQHRFPSLITLARNESESRRHRRRHHRMHHTVPLDLPLNTAIVMTNTMIIITARIVAAKTTITNIRVTHPTTTDARIVMGPTPIRSRRRIRDARIGTIRPHFMPHRPIIVVHVMIECTIAIMITMTEAWSDREITIAIATLSRCQTRNAPIQPLRVPTRMIQIVRSHPIVIGKVSTSRWKCREIVAHLVINDPVPTIRTMQMTDRRCDQ